MTFIQADSYFVLQSLLGKVMTMMFGSATVPDPFLWLIEEVIS